MFAAVRLVPAATIFRCPVVGFVPAITDPFPYTAACPVNTKRIWWKSIDAGRHFPIPCSAAILTVCIARSQLVAILEFVAAHGNLQHGLTDALRSHSGAAQGGMCAALANVEEDN